MKIRPVIFGAVALFGVTIAGVMLYEMATDPIWTRDPWLSRPWPLAIGVLLMSVIAIVRAIQEW